MDEWVIEPLSKQHERGSFSCGKGPLDAFLRHHALANTRRGISRVFVATRPGDKIVCGFYAASAGTISCSDLPVESQQGLPKYPLPTGHLGRLAVDLTCQGKRLGETILFHFFEQILNATANLGIYAVDVFSKDEQAKTFYLKYGFRVLSDDPLHLYLPITTVRQIFEAAS